MINNEAMANQKIGQLIPESRQILLLSNNCFQKNTILHEIMHAIGF